MTVISPQDFQSEQARQLAEKHSIEQSLNFVLLKIHHTIKDYIDLRYGCAYYEDSVVWGQRVDEAESARKALVSAMKRLSREYGMNFDLGAEE
jgi:hypothetical protein